MTEPCRIKPEELIAFQDGTLPAGRREIVEAHLVACPHCRERMVTYREVDDLIRGHAAPIEGLPSHRSALHARLRRESARPRHRWSPVALAHRWHPVFTGLVVALLVALVAVPAVTRADFPLDRFVRFGKVDVTERLPPEDQVPIRHVAPSDPDVRRPSFQPVAPAELPLGLVRVEQSTPDADRVEVLYRNDAGVAIMVVQIPITAGAVTLDSPGVDRAVVRDTEVVITRDTRPDAVAALIWERGDVIFDVMVIEAPIGPYGGFRKTDALQVVEALMEAQDAGQE